MIVVGRHVFFRAVLRWGAALAFCYPLKHRERFWLRAVELLLSLMALTWLLDPMAQSNSLVQLQISLLGMYVGFFILLGAMIYACVEIDKKSALYCAVWSLLTAQTAYEGWNLFELLCAVKSHPLNMNSVPVKLLQVLAWCSMESSAGHWPGRSRTKACTTSGPGSWPARFLWGLCSCCRRRF